MRTKDLSQEKIRMIGELFPNCVTETRERERERVVRSIDFDALRQELSDHIVEGPKERYQFTWPDKSKAKLLANTPTTKTLRPCREESVDFDNTKNLYIEGDNLEVLKILRETYLGKIKMIYIDPPYNTGNDFVYDDDYSMSIKDYSVVNGESDDSGDRLFLNTSSNGRFHTDWLNMIYPRLLLARDFLSDDGVIFISIDDNEQANLTKICDEIFGNVNAIGPFIQNKQNTKNDSINVQKNHEYILAYRKKTIVEGTHVKPTLTNVVTTYRDVFEEKSRVYYLNDPITTRGEGGTLRARPNLGYSVYYNELTGEIIPKMDYDIQLAKKSNDESEVYSDDKQLIDDGFVIIRPPKVRGKLGCWTWSFEKIIKDIDNIVIAGRPGSYTLRKRTFVDRSKVIMIEGKMKYPSESLTNSRSIIDYPTSVGSSSFKDLMETDCFFNNPKNPEMIKYVFSTPLS
ncbi:MAG: site-specific DNA-methyltransferase [Candidatus Methanomethylophilaceae archaeon]|nr:site-specific DNA-methyltransferase [Candidatus Methanomethylophilaceae archaeon]